MVSGVISAVRYHWAAKYATVTINKGSKDYARETLGRAQPRLPCDMMPESYGMLLGVGKSLLFIHRCFSCFKFRQSALVC